MAGDVNIMVVPLVFDIEPGTPPDSLVRLLRQRLGHDGEVYLVAAPGRVNIVGEHTDYNGFPVLPFAIDREIRIAFVLSDDETIELTSIDGYGARSFQVDESRSPYTQGDWGNYIKAAVRGFLEEGVIDAGRARGFKGICAGDIPVSAGLSSSSALVVASGMAFLKANGLEMDSMACAGILARSERYAGIEGGGMDQAVSLMGKRDTALKIDFFPLRIRPVPLLDEHVFVVCNSMVQASKTASARASYNRRVVECRLAATMLRAALVKRTGVLIDADRLGDFNPEKTGFSWEELERMADEIMRGSPLPLSVIADRVGMSVDDLVEKRCTLRDGSVFIQPEEGYEVRKRFLHVASEARRVEETADALRCGDAVAVGRLMNRSHESCRDNYEISCDELETLTSIARECGAIGSRLTGAGFGGCTVNLVESSFLSSFMRNVKEKYYEDYLGIILDSEKQEKILFPCRASDGARIYRYR